jgi:hypothetical protein
MYGGIAEDHIDRVVYALGDKAIEAVSLYGADSYPLRVAEIELRVDWNRNAELTLSVPMISGGLPGWDGNQAPEVKLVGHRFAETVSKLGLWVGWWISLAPWIENNPELHSQWRSWLEMNGQPPAWKNPPIERSDQFIDINEATFFMRRASD